MALEALIEKRPRNASRIVGEQLRLDPMDAGGLLQRLDYMREQLYFDFVRVRNPAAVRDIKIADHSLAAFIHKEAVTENAPAINGGVSGQDFSVDIAQDHLRRPVVIPREQARPRARLIVEQGAQVDRRKMSEIKNLHGAPANSAAKRR